MPTAWFLMALLAALVGIVATSWSAWCAAWFRLEDPRTIALIRIALPILLVVNVHGLSPWHALLLGNDGMYDAAGAREAFTPPGHGEGVRAVVWAIVQGPASLLYVSDSPHALGLVLAAFDVAAVLVGVGLFTRPAGVLLLVLHESILVRNFVFWEGTELLLRITLVILVCARSGAAYSIDAWRWRRRDPSARPHPPIPGWPRRLLAVQAAVVLTTTGLLKHDGAWLSGDAVYYALTYEHFARFRVQGLLAALGDAPLAALTWGARTVEVGFGLVLVGPAARTLAEPVRRAGLRRAAIVVAVLSVAGLIAGCGGPRLLPVASTPLAVCSWLALAGASLWIWHPRAPPWARRLRILYARRVWLPAAATLMVGLWLTMNIGVFHPAMLLVLVAFVRGEEVGRIAARHEARPSAPSSVLAYDPRTRHLGGVLLAWHLLAVLLAVMPRAPGIDPVRDRVGLLAGPWLRATRTEQSWGMWSTVPTDNIFLRAVVVDTAGVRHDLHTDLYAAERFPPPPWPYDRWWKIAERLAKAARDRDRIAYARWLCRQPLPDTDATAQAVELDAIEVPIPSPHDNRAAGGYDRDHVLATRARARPLLRRTCPGY